MTDIGENLAEDLTGVIRSLAGPILILGAGGFVGANLFRILRGSRDDVVAAVHSAPGWRLAGFDHVEQVDVTSRTSVDALLARTRPQIVFDCTSFGGYSFQTDAARIHQVNYLGVVNVVESLAARGFTAYIHAGTSSEYGANSAGPDELDPLRPNSQYAASKVAAQDYLAYCGYNRGLPVLNLRLYSVYGPFEEPTRLVPTLLRSVLDGSRPELSSPDPVRDFVFVDDVCAAFVLAARSMRPELAGSSVNIGSGREASVGELVELLRAGHPGLDPVYGRADAKPWEVPHWYAKIDRARDDLGWAASTRLADGLARTLDWMSDRDATGSAVPTAAKPSVSAVIACYNEGPAVPLMAERLTATFRRIGCDYEIIFVNNGSTDDTAQNLLTMSAADPHVIGINHSRSFGSQMAFYSGMDLAGKDAVVILDGDLQDPPELIEQMYARMLDGYDVVFGHRVRREMSRETLFW